jgi:hypothetical protein
MTMMAAAVPPQRDEVPVLPSGAPDDRLPDGYVSLSAFMALPGMTYRKLDYWARTGILRPENPSAGSGVKRIFAYDELGVAAALLRLLSCGFSLHFAREVARGPRPHAEGFAVIAAPAHGIRLVVTPELWQVPE